MIRVSRRLWISGLAYLTAQAVLLSSSTFAKVRRTDGKGAPGDVRDDSRNISIDDGGKRSVAEQTAAGERSADPLTFSASSRAVPPTLGRASRRAPDRVFDLGVLVNEFGAVGDGRSHPLATKYETLAAAQMDYPFAQSLHDEIDWCAWMAALLEIYNSKGQVIGGRNYSSGTIYADGQYVVNRTIVCNVASIEIIGKSIGVVSEYPGTSIKYNGPPGTLEQPVWIFDCYTIEELTGPNFNRTTQPGASVRSGADSGGRFCFRNITVLGQNGDMRANSISVSKFVGGIRLRMASFSQITNCGFSQTLWDAIAATGPQQFLIIERCRFDGIHRDAISVRSIKNNFSTAVWVQENEFAFVGRYSILLDVWGSVESACRVINNDFEHTYSQSYFVRNPEWWVQGAVAGMCFNNAGNLNFRDNRTENIILTAGYLCEMHLVSCQNPAIRDSTLHKILCTARTRNERPRTAALIDYVNTNGYGDITNERNYNCGSSSDNSGPVDSPSFSNIYNMLELIVADGIGVTNQGLISLNMVGFIIHSFPVKAATYSIIIDPSKEPTLLPISQYSACADASFLPATTSINSTGGNQIQLQEYFGRWDNLLGARLGYDGERELEIFESWWRWGNNGNADGSAAASWNGYRGLTWNRLLKDFTVAPEALLNLPMWYARVVDSGGKPVAYYEVAGSVITRRKVRYDYSAPPASGSWNHGDIVYNSNPISGGFIGWVCIGTGSPGTWKAFGLIT